MVTQVVTLGKILYSVVPDFLRETNIRAYVVRSEISKAIRVGGRNAATYITNREAAGRPIPHKLAMARAPKSTVRHYRILDVLVAAKADGLKVENPADYVSDMTSKIQELETTLEKLQQQLELAKVEHVKDRAIGFNQFGINKLALAAESDIVSMATEIGSTSGVYFLVARNKIVYVGQSTNVFARVASHINENKKQFDSCSFIKCNPRTLNVLESLYIHTLKPKYNFDKSGRLITPINISNLLESIDSANRNVSEESKAN